MGTMKTLIEFLRLRRRYEEYEKKHAGEQPDVALQYLDDSNVNYTVDANTFYSDFTRYKRIVGLLDYYNVTTIYLWETPTVRKYLLKTSRGDYRTIPDNTIVTPRKSELTEFKLEAATYDYLYDADCERVVILVRTFSPIVVFSDTLKYVPDGPYLKDVENGKYDYTVSLPIDRRGAYRSFQIHEIYQEYPEKKDTVTIQKSEKGGVISIIPVLSVDLALQSFVLKYPYYKKGFQPSFALRDDDCALVLKFGWIGGLLTFLNQTLFSQKFTIGETGQLLRDNFRQQFREQIIKTMERRIKSNVEFYYRDALKILFYLPDSVAQTIDTDALWKMIENGIHTSELVDDYLLLEGKLFIKLLLTLLEKEHQSEKLIERLSQKMTNKSEYKGVSFHKEDTLLESLYHRLGGSNLTTFLYLINQAWRKTRFVIPSTETNPEFSSTDGPLFLSYKSEKLFGLFFSNAKITFKNKTDKESLLRVAYETGRYHSVVAANLTGEKDEEIIEYYWYHPFYPVYLNDIEKQDTKIAMDRIVPAFMLKANRDEQFTSNVFTSLEYGLDVVTTLSGLGNIAKFRYLGRVVQLAEAAEGVNAMTKVAKAANILRTIKGAAGVVEITSGTVNLMLKLTGARDTVFGEVLSKVLFYLELITMAGELTTSLRQGLKKSAKEAVEASDGALRLRHPELFFELYKIIGLDDLGRKLVYIVNAEDMGKQVNKIVFKLVDHTGNEIGELIRSVGMQGRSTKYQLVVAGRKIDLNSEVTLYNFQMGKADNFPVNAKEEILYADLNIPSEITQQYSGFGELILDESLACFRNNPKLGKVDGNIGYWIKFDEYYKGYGGQSINLKQFWKAVDAKKTYEDAAFETFTGQWARRNGFEKVTWRGADDIQREKVILKFFK